MTASAEATTPGGPPTDPVDLGVVLAGVEGDRDILAELVGVFLDDCPRQLAKLYATIEHGDLEGAWERAHTLKGALGAVGAHAARAGAARLESLARAGDVAGLRAAASGVVAEVARVMTFLADRSLWQRGDAPR
jgi:two-component system, sensor histidine kinase and response regulator